jgi:hypothetical protein
MKLSEISRITDPLIGVWLTALLSALDERPDPEHDDTRRGGGVRSSATEHGRPILPRCRSSSGRRSPMASMKMRLRPFSAYPQQGGKIKVSEGGGTEARWRRDGKELLYLSGETKMMAVEVSTTPSFKAGVPQPLFQTRVRRGSGFQWDASPDGKRFLFATVAAEKSDAITIVTN